MLTRAELAAIVAVLETRLGWDHPLTQAAQRAHEATPPEMPSEQPMTSTDISADSDERAVQWDPQN